MKRILGIATVTWALAVGIGAEASAKETCLSEDDLLGGTASSLRKRIYESSPRPKPCSGRANLILSGIMPNLYMGIYGVSEEFQYEETDIFFQISRNSLFSIENRYPDLRGARGSLRVLDEALQHIGRNVADNSFRKELYKIYVDHVARCFNEREGGGDDFYFIATLNKCIISKDIKKESCVIKVDLYGFTLDKIRESAAYRFCIEE